MNPLSAYFIFNLNFIAAVLSIFPAVIIISKIRMIRGTRPFFTQYLFYLYMFIIFGVLWLFSRVQTSREHFFLIEKSFLPFARILLPVFFIHFAFTFIEWSPWKRILIKAYIIAPFFIFFTILRTLSSIKTTADVSGTYFGFFLQSNSFWLNMLLMYNALVQLYILYLFYRYLHNRINGRKAYAVFAGGAMFTYFSYASFAVFPKLKEVIPSLEIVSHGVFMAGIYLMCRISGVIVKSGLAADVYSRVAAFLEPGLSFSADTDKEKLLQNLTENLLIVSEGNTVVFIEIFLSADSFQPLYFAVKKKIVQNILLSDLITKKLNFFGEHSFTDVPVKLFKDAVQKRKPIVAHDLYPLFGGTISKTTAALAQKLAGSNSYAILPIIVGTLPNTRYGVLVFSLPEYKQDLTLYMMFARLFETVTTHYQLLDHFKTIEKERTLVLDILPMHVYYLDDSLAIGFANSGFCDFYSTTPENVIGKKAETFFKNSHNVIIFEKNARTVLGKSVAASFVIEEEKNGVVHTFRVNLTPVLLHAFKGKIMVQAMDITNERRAHEEARRLEQKLVQMEKMESIGHLAGGIAHDFNNQLTSILGYTEILKNTLADNQRAQVFIDSIARAARHSSEITSKLLAFARRDHYQNQTFLFNQLVSETAGGFVLPEGVTLRLALSEYPLYMTGDYTQCRNLTAYLLQNAVESITSEGEITVSTQRAVLSGNDPVCIARSIMPGKYIKLCVCDSGCGIPTDITDKIFSPFYSTKNTSEHAGLGLSAVSGIAAGYNGCVSFAPGEGGGTEFIVYLPESEDPVAGESRRESVTNKDFGTVNAVSSAASRAIILVIDSEKTVLDAILQLLEVVNCRAHGFTKPGTALAYFRNNWKEITAVFADSSGGSRAIHTLCGQIRSINPAVPIVYCTGSPADTAQRAVKENAMFAHLQKPFDVEELEGIISCLDFSPPQRS